MHNGVDPVVDLLCSHISSPVTASILRVRRCVHRPRQSHHGVPWTTFEAMLVVQPVGKTECNYLRPWVPELWDIDGVGKICDTCSDYGCPPHGRYVQTVLKVSRTSAKPIAAFAYPVYAEAIRYAAYPAAVVQGG